MSAMPFLAYVHSREAGPPQGPGEGPPEGPGHERRVWQPNWTLWRWVLAGAAFAVASAYSSGGFELLLVLLAFVCACRAATVSLPSLDGGMNEYRQ